MPECTKCNGKGVLEVPKQALDFLRDALLKDEFKVHALRFDYTFSYWSPYNSTDVSGYSHFLASLAQFSSKMRVQYHFNLQEKKDCKASMTDESLQRVIGMAL